MTKPITTESPEKTLKKAQAFWEKGKQKQAYDLCATFLRANPNYGPMLHFFAFVLEKQGNLFGAMKHLEFACKAPNPKSIYFIDLAKMMIEQGMFVEALNVLNVAMKSDPGNLEIQGKLADMLIVNGFHDQGVKLFSLILTKMPNDWQVWSKFAQSVATSSRPAKAMELFDHTLEITNSALRSTQTEPVPAPSGYEIAQILMNKSDHLKAMGKTAECEAVIREAITHSKFFSRAWAELATLKAFSDDDFDTVENLIRKERTKLSPLDLQYLHHALGQAQMTRGHSAKAMVHYIKANKLQRENLVYNEENTLGYMKSLQNFYTPDVIKTHSISEEIDEQQFIFIVGMPRSGSSLIEQILDSHNHAYGVGEIKTMPNLHRRVYGNGFPSLPQHAKLVADQKRLSLFAKTYRDEVLRTLPPEAYQNGQPPRFIVDKMLGNFVSVGLIAMAFPNSKIIHSRRDPVDTAFSCFTHFFADGHKYLCDLAEIGRFYLGYRDLMTHWEKAVPNDQLITVDYEKVIDDLDGEARRLTDFLGLEWQEQCLEFYANKREVRTHSALEVRKPIYRTSVERWRPYEKELAPLFEALGITPA